MNALEQLLTFLARLDAYSIRYSLAHDRAEAITVRLQLPGERWDVGFLADGTVDVETFAGSDGVASGAEAQELLTRLFVSSGSDA